MIEVFRTNVNDPDLAQQLIARIEARFATYRASFDLEDCDRVLRVVSESGDLDTECVLALMRSFGCYAEILPDEQLPGNATSF